MLIGHNKQKKYFQNLIKNEALSHAYLFSGPEMIGKKTFALDIYKLLNGRESDNDPDFKFIAPKVSEDEHKIYIEDIRALKSFFSFKPYAGPYKVAVIDDAHTLTPEAGNALLKLLEEPPSFSMIILVSSLPGLLPATLVSRCEEVRFIPASTKEIEEHLLTYKKISREDKDFVVKLAGGRIGFINELVVGKDLDDAKKAIDDLRKLLKGGIFERMDYAKKSFEKESYSQLVNYWTHWVSAHLKTSPKNEKIVKDLLILSDLISQPQFNHRLALENFLLNL